MIEPGSTVPLVYQNVVYTTDSTLYYVRAVVRDSLFGTILATKNLTHQGNGRYTSSFRAPEDPTGQGRHIDITITVYTDAGYTTKSPDYEERNYNYLLKSSFSLGAGGGSGDSGSSIDYQYIKKLFEEVILEFVKAIPKPPKIPKTKPVNLKKIENRLGEILDFALPDIRGAIKPPEEVKFDNVISKIEEVAKSLGQKVEDKEVTKVDLSPVISSLSTLAKSLEAFQKEGSSGQSEIKKLIENIYSGKIKQYMEVFSKLSGIVSGLDKEMLPEPKKELTAAEKNAAELFNTIYRQ